MSARRLSLFAASVALVAPTLTGGHPAQPRDARQLPAVPVRGPPPPELPEMVRRDDAGGATMRATRLTEPLDFDGRLDEAIYQEIPGVSDFIQTVPLEGATATEPTEVWVFFDDEAIYIAGRCRDSRPDRIVATELRRDHGGIFLNQHLAVTLDTFYDRRNAFIFYLNPLGGFFDGLITDERNFNRDWTAVWDSRTDRFEGGWTTELRIPFKTLRYPGAGAQVWGINFRRVIVWKNETSYLTAMPAALGIWAITKVSSYGTLVGLEAPPSSRTLEVKPYVVGDAAGDRGAEPHLDRHFGSDFGVDAKVGITNGLTADLTWNTDFAQVEADTQQINLTRFSLFFPEKREFFLEGQGLFAFGTSERTQRASSRRPGGPSSVPILFFSRRIGIHDNEVAPIRGGARVTGKVGDFGVGALAIRTGKSASGAPQTDFTVFRLKRDILRRSTIGAIGTHRSDAGIGLGSNTAWGMDARFGFHDHLDLRSYAAWTRNGQAERTGMSYRGQLDYDADRYGLQVERLVVGEDFDPGIGFLRRDDFRRSYAEARFSPRPRSIAWLRKIGWAASFDDTTDNDGELETRIAAIRSDIEIENGDSLQVRWAQNREVLPEAFRLTDALAVATGAHDFETVRLSYRAGPQRPISGNFAYQDGGFFSGTRREIAWSGRLEVIPRFIVEPTISLNWISLPEGRYDTRLLASRLNLNLSPRSFLAAFLQYNSAADSFSTNVRFRWEYEPGSDLYLVYNSIRDTLTPGYPDLDTQSFIVKFTRLFRF